MLNQLDSPLHVAIDVEVLLAYDLTVDLDGLSDGRGAARAIQVGISGHAGHIRRCRLLLDGNGTLQGWRQLWSNGGHRGFRRFIFPALVPHTHDSFLPVKNWIMNLFL